MKHNLMSKMGYHASLHIFEETPSQYLPFSGNIPVLDKCYKKDYMDYVQNKMYVEDCPDWVQEATLTGEFIFTLELNFKDYLKNKKLLDKWSDMSSSDRATVLVRFLDSQSLGLSALELS